MELTYATEMVSGLIVLNIFWAEHLYSICGVYSSFHYLCMQMLVGLKQEGYYLDGESVVTLTLGRIPIAPFTYSTATGLDSDSFKMLAYSFDIMLSKNSMKVVVDSFHGIEIVYRPWYIYWHDVVRHFVISRQVVDWMNTETALRRINLNQFILFRAYY